MMLKTGHPHAKQWNLYTDITPFTKINPKWTTDFNVKCKTLQLLGDNREENLGNMSLAMPSQIQHWKHNP